MICLTVGSSILCFRYEAICPNTVQIPARQVQTQRAAEHTWLHKEVDDLAEVVLNETALSYTNHACSWKNNDFCC